jgi:hypothetical protein
MATQLQNLGGVSVIVVGASFCEHNDQVHSLVDLLAAKAGLGAETETGLDNKSAVAFEKHRIRLRMAAGAWAQTLQALRGICLLPVTRVSTATHNEHVRLEESGKLFEFIEVDTAGLGADSVRKGFEEE